MLSDDELGRIRSHAIANPSHAGDVALRLVAEVERLTRELTAIRTAHRITGMLQGTMGLEGQALDDAALRSMTEATAKELLAGLDATPTEGGT